MSNNSDPLFDRYADMDFTDAKPVSEIPALAQLQAEQGGKSRITMRVDNDTLAFFKARAEMCGGSYQTLMNEALRQFSQGLTLAEVVKETIRQELHRAP
ncbi:MAG: BrnA antitoxin family protein [Methylobacter sp.]